MLFREAPIRQEQRTTEIFQTCVCTFRDQFLFCTILPREDPLPTNTSSPERGTEVVKLGKFLRVHTVNSTVLNRTLGSKWACLGSLNHGKRQTGGAGPTPSLVFPTQHFQHLGSSPGRRAFSPMYNAYNFIHFCLHEILNS